MRIYFSIFDKGSPLTSWAFKKSLEPVTGSWGYLLVTIAVFFFGLSTAISWSYYGTRAANYLFGEKYIKPYSYLYAIFVFLGSIFGIELVWHFVDMVITFMTIPNLIALILLSGVVVKETNSYFDKMKKLKRSRTHH